MKFVKTRTVNPIDDMSVVYWSNKKNFCTTIVMRSDDKSGNHKIAQTREFGHFVSN